MATKELTAHSLYEGTFSVGLDKKFNHIKQKVLEELKEKIKPEILNRLDEIIVFDSLDQKDIEKIIDKDMGGLMNEISGGKMTLATLKQFLWKSADILRGKIDSSDYKKYIFGCWAAIRCKQATFA